MLSCKWIRGPALWLNLVEMDGAERRGRLRFAKSEFSGFGNFRITPFQQPSIPDARQTSLRHAILAHQHPGNSDHIHRSSAPQQV